MVSLPIEAYKYIVDAKANEKPLLKKEAPEHIKESVRKANAGIISLGGEKMFIIEGEDIESADPIKNKFEEYDGYEMPEQQGFASPADKEKAEKEHEERLKRIKEANNII